MKHKMNRMTRKQIAALLTASLGQEISVDMVRKNGVAWGIEHHKIRRQLNNRVVTYDGHKVIQALIRAKVLGTQAATAASSFR